MFVQGRVLLAGRTGRLCVAERSWWSARGWPATPVNTKEATNNLVPAFDKNKIMTIYYSSAAEKFSVRILSDAVNHS